MSINHHASTQKINWYGNDYNPTQKNFAQYISTLCNSGAVLTEKSFAQLSENCDWPKFDYIFYLIRRLLFYLLKKQRATRSHTVKFFLTELAFLIEFLTLVSLYLL